MVKQVLQNYHTKNNISKDSQIKRVLSLDALWLNQYITIVLHNKIHDLTQETNFTDEELQKIKNFVREQEKIIKKLKKSLCLLFPKHSTSLTVFSRFYSNRKYGERATWSIFPRVFVEFRKEIIKQKKTNEIGIFH